MQIVVLLSKFGESSTGGRDVSNAGKDDDVWFGEEFLDETESETTVRTGDWKSGGIMSERKKKLYQQRRTGGKWSDVQAEGLAHRHKR